MTRQEFYEWVEFHGASFDAWAAWVNKQGRQCQEQLYETLNKRELVDAKAATMLMLRGALPEAKSFGAHVTIIFRASYDLQKERAAEHRQAVKEKPRRFVHGHELFDCPVCRDDGYIEVWHPVTIRKAITGDSIEPINTSWAACSCKMGDEHVEKSCFDSETRQRITLRFPRLGEHPSVVLFQTWDGATAIRNDAGLNEFVAAHNAGRSF